MKENYGQKQLREEKIYFSSSPTSKSITEGTWRAGAKAETIEERCLLACFLSLLLPIQGPLL